MVKWKLTNIENRVRSISFHLRTPSMHTWLYVLGKCGLTQKKKKRAETTNHLISDDDVLFHIKAAKTQKISFLDKLCKEDGAGNLILST